MSNQPYEYSDNKMTELALELLELNFNQFFDYMAALYETDTEAFVRLQTAILQRRINQIADGDDVKTKRLNGALWRRQIEIDRSNDPLNTSVRLFWEDVAKFKTTLNENLPRLQEVLRGTDETN